MDQPNNSSGPRGAHFAAPKDDVAPRQGVASVRRMSARTEEATQRAASRNGSCSRRRPARRGSSRRAVLVGAVVVLAVLLGIFAGVRLAGRLLAPSEQPATVEAGKSVTVTIPEGSGATDIAIRLKDVGVISTTDEFYQELKSQKAEQKLKCGTYSFVTGGNVSEIVRQLQAGPNTSESRLQVPEGLTVDKTAELVESSLGIPKADFLAQAKASNYVTEFPFLKEAKDDSLEGFLCPKTYDFSGKEVSADSVIRAMLAQYQSDVASIDFASGEAKVKDAYGLTLSDYDVLTLASVIEREAVTEEDRPLVASVFYNRLRSDMALQSDATMGYVTGGDVTAEDLKQESPYNSYLHKGLPPTPICTPSVESIRAALDPASTDYYYFLIIEKDSYSNHTFSKTYEEHEAAIEKAKADQAD